MKQLILASLILAISCKSAMPTVETSTDPAKNTLAEILGADTTLRPWLSNRDTLNIQVVYTRIDRDSKGKPVFTDFHYNVDPGKYFYPASTVKMPVAFLALEKLNELRAAGVNIDKNSVMVTDSSFPGQQVAYTQPASEDSRASIAHYIKQIFLVSDNDAFNRLYEFLGQEYIYNKLQEKGYHNSVIRHRLAIVLSPEQNRHTNPVSFHDTSGAAVYEQAAVYSNAVFPEKEIRMGRGYYSGGRLVNGGFDFSLKNNVAVADLHHQLRNLVFPPSKKSQRFDITEEDRRFLLRWLSSVPRESRYPYYDTTEYPDDYTKFIGRGLLQQKGVRVFSKAGWAYGFLTDVAYVIDPANGVEFMLSATVLCNSDGIFNDDRYDFEKTGYPFMQKIGELVYRHELQRKKQVKPDLSAFHFDYTAE